MLSLEGDCTTENMIEMLISYDSSKELTAHKQITYIHLIGFHLVIYFSKYLVMWKTNSIFVSFDWLNLPVSALIKLTSLTIFFPFLSSLTIFTSPTFQITKDLIQVNKYIRVTKLNFLFCNSKKKHL